MGGAIFNQGTLAMTNVTITGSTALGGSCITNGLAGGGGGMGQRWHLLPRRRFWGHLCRRGRSWRQFGGRGRRRWRRISAG